MEALTRRLRVAWTDAGLAAAALVLSQLQVWLSDPVAMRAVGAPTEAISAIAVTWRRRAPLATLVAVLVPFTIPVVVRGRPTEPGAIGIAWLLAVYSAAAYAEGRKVIVAIGLTFAVNVVLQLPAAPVTMNDVIAVFLLSSAVPLLAGLLRRRHVQAKLLEEKATALQREQRERAAEAVAEERARIARELHDVVAHGVSVMVVQAEAGDAVFESDPTTARDALKAIQGSGREALTDLRRMLGVLREAPSATTAPQPSLARVGELVAQLRSAGMDVELRIEGARAPLPRGLDMAAFRIVQEALTNVLKHAGPVPVRVSVRYEPHALELEVVNDGRPLRPTKESGHGLTGIAERVAVFGGVYEAGPQAEGGFRLRVQLPLSPAS